MRILLVDDEEGFLSLMCDLLSFAGHTVLPACNGKIARELIQAENVDLIISDLQMPTLDGARFHSFVRDFSARSDVPFVFISGYADTPGNLLADPTRDFFMRKDAPAQALLDLIDSISKAAPPRNAYARA